ncbi:hypothetical protein F53441_6426 [Fusarium austroafricanum]|uniref:FAD linked oxidase N-terminal domain-containing protein n=1 Tax=Fusarium austroafricanum TaxID=2364996 RepID=A0A8H4KFT7_9HYPO|nr:hypothetical protein F53441_6426 [Fusarium austroafricanum]
MTVTTDQTFQGNQFLPGTASYNRANQLYATSTYGKERDMYPGEILQPASIEDIQMLVKGAVKAGRPIAIRSGGHQYSGASSTNPNGIQLDLKPTFRRPNIDLNVVRENGKVYLRSSCSTVCLGGHVQTGGYGMLARSFGLLGDYVRELDIIDYKGEVVKVTKNSHPDLFYGLLGGSPGNLGVLTHFKIEVQDDKNYQGSKGLWMGFHYNQATLETLLDILVQKGEDENFPRGYDFTVNIVSRQANLLDLFPGSEEELKEMLPDKIHNGKDNIADLLKFKYAMIIVYAQWVSIPGGEPYSSDLFNQIKKVKSDFSFFKESLEGAQMSQIASMWLFASPREFPLPYDKRTNSTKSLELSKTGWAKWFSGRINDLVETKGNGLWVSSQLQVYGGKQSVFQKNANNGTAYCFRDATFGGTWDAFYQDSKTAAEKWQAENDEGRPKYFSKEDRRVLWGSYGDWEMKKVHQFYYDLDTYKKMQKIRQTYDPNGTFTANPFCVEALK